MEWRANSSKEKSRNLSKSEERKNSAPTMTYRNKKSLLIFASQRETLLAHLAVAVAIGSVVRRQFQGELVATVVGVDDR